MKPRHSFVNHVLVILAFVCAISISSVVQGSHLPGRLIVQRVPNFGWNLAFHLQIDGTSVANIAQGHRFEAWLPAGRHVLTVSKVPYTGYAGPTSTIVDVQPGWDLCVYCNLGLSLSFSPPNSGVVDPRGGMAKLRPPLTPFADW